MDRFAYFFKAPLFTATAIEREIRVVDSENVSRCQVCLWGGCAWDWESFCNQILYPIVIQNDSVRTSRLFSHLVCPSHPMFKFECGSLQTLLYDPNANGVDVRSHLLQFYETHYSSQNMRAGAIEIYRYGYDRPFCFLMYSHPWWYLSAGVCGRPRITGWIEGNGHRKIFRCVLLRCITNRFHTFVHQTSLVKICPYSNTVGARMMV